MPKVSVIIPAYNAEKFIKETIESVCIQSFKDWELLVINDGSSDQTESIVSPLCQSDHRIRLINQPNRGVSAARNTGIKHSKGDYLAFLDADDIWDSDFLFKCTNALEANKDFHLAHTDLEEIDEFGNFRGVRKKGEHGHLLNSLLEWSGHVMPPPSGILVRKEILEKIGGFDEELSNNADQEFYFRAAAVSPFYRIQESLLRYRVHSNNMHMNIQLLSKDTLRAYRKAKDAGLFESNDFERRCFANMYLILAINFLRHKRNYTKFGWFFAKSVWVYPPIIFRLLNKLIK